MQLYACGVAVDYPQAGMQAMRHEDSNAQAATEGAPCAFHNRKNIALCISSAHAGKAPPSLDAHLSSGQTR